MFVQPLPRAIRSFSETGLRQARSDAAIRKKRRRKHVIGFGQGASPVKTPATLTARNLNGRFAA